MLPRKAAASLEWCITMFTVSRCPDRILCRDPEGFLTTSLLSVSRAAPVRDLVRGRTRMVDTCKISRVPPRFERELFLVARRLNRGCLLFTRGRLLFTLLDLDETMHCNLIGSSVQATTLSDNKEEFTENTIDDTFLNLRYLWILPMDDFWCLLEVWRNTFSFRMLRSPLYAKLSNNTCAYFYDRAVSVRNVQPDPKRNARIHIHMHTFLNESAFVLKSSFIGKMFRRFAGFIKARKTHWWYNYQYYVWRFLAKLAAVSCNVRWNIDALRAVGHGFNPFATRDDYGRLSRSDPPRYRNDYSRLTHDVHIFSLDGSLQEARCFSILRKSVRKLAIIATR